MQDKGQDTALQARDRRIRELEEQNRRLADRVAALQRALLTPTGASVARPTATLPGVSWQVGGTKDAAEPPLPLPLSQGSRERVEQLGRVKGWHADGWAEQVAFFTLMVRQPVSRIVVGVWVPAESAPYGQEMQIVCNGRTLCNDPVASGQVVGLAADLAAEPGDLLAVELRAGVSFALPPPDVRRLSYVLKGIEIA